MRKILLLLFVFYSFNSIAQKNSQILLQSRVITTNGDTLYLQDTLKSINPQIQNNVFLIDYWASWCKPCLREMPESKKLQQKFTNQNLIFVYLSTDKNNKEWLNRLDKLQIKGHHFRIVTEDKAPIAEEFKIKGIPFYQILNANFQVLKNNAPWPNNRKLSKLLSTYLEK